ncbi:hypothetical protein BAE44_0017926 [Dichanthelium oligosanthes]|uniref:Uncharacterized protein n=1 Tax=Dichanthelium oligosanthes TaxID=888268 RepID=A0A1E5V7A9_9POAL|nr:hypothetical protein BAE44_0017926 [Dichanthelium oligosanthes]
MTNFELDPRTHVPRGFEVIPHDHAAPPLRLSTHIGGCMEMYNENLGITFLVPVVSKQDFKPMATALKDYFIHTHGVFLVEIPHDVVVSTGLPPRARSWTCPVYALMSLFFIPSLQANHIFFSLSKLIMDLDTVVPSFIVDDDVLLYLAQTYVDQPALVMFGPPPPPSWLPLIPYSDDEDDEDELRDITGPLLFMLASVVHAR